MSTNNVDICVSVDFGVAWVKPQVKDFPIQVISDWPGDGITNERKVPSVLSKHVDSRGLRKWGFLCEEDMNEADKWRYLKIFLDPAQYRLSRQEGLSWAPQSLSLVHSLVTEYLRQIYLHIRRSITLGIGRPEYQGWDDLAVEFVFSVPTTWEGQEILDDFQTVIRNAGFGRPEKHDVVLGLTEAEAAAVASMRHFGSGIPFDNDDVFLSIDAGGGTTDLAFVRIISANPPVMEQIQAVKGTGIGSMMIDKDFRGMVNERLKRYPGLRAQLPRDLPLKLSQSPYYRTQKHKFGETSYEREVYRIGVLGLRHDYHHEGLGIENGHLKLRREELEGIFNNQLNKILTTLSEALDKFEQDGYKSVRYIVLSGGLGSSPYILRKVEEYVQNQLLTRPVLKGTRVHMSAEPQLVIVKGLLLEQTNSILRTRIARANYGLITSSRYSKKNADHFGQAIRCDIFDGKSYVDDQIRWIVKRGEKIANGQMLSAPVVRRAGLTEPLRWTETIVLSDTNVTQLYKIQADLTDVQSSLTLKKRRHKWLFWRIKSQYYICEYDIQLRIGPSGDLRFEVHHNGQPVAGSAAPVKVQIEAEWDTSPNEPEPESETSPAIPHTSSATLMSIGSWGSSQGSLGRHAPVSTDFWAAQAQIVR
ncbi:hypothetical protein QBC41DRAFT_344684 [Cercophora samala]|uniref:Uncharacterized protein n=1 Tax=Cercophora samala TaxID=330535 RepID=A0AA40DEM8_9PEZI|nr:hypothetical protein QBC41DRAFT_344684 [Cercophora samala]